MSDQESLPIERRIAAFVLHDPLVKILKGKTLDEGHSDVVISVFNELPEHTPKDFTPSNDLETYLFANKKASDIKVTLPFAFKAADLVKAIASSMVTYEKEWYCEVQTTMKHATSDIQIEFTSKNLKRSLFVVMTSVAGK